MSYKKTLLRESNFKTVKLLSLIQLVIVIWALTRNLRLIVINQFQLCQIKRRVYLIN